ncbi:hypothetical protein K5V07_09075 [Flavobacterium sp. CHNK8]|uniref:fibronectin type III domain-containing protein n=1 Tax=Flavobacterium sp. CHNK8 TaxID=2871165 RepID=UPI001C8E3BE9|nr:hypothetical protein [Flavobacterium sp. CHNK8]QZK90635.1 hypothetical protein K5V07_09075 [Flavobacterium sp. CHNK8]
MKQVNFSNSGGFPLEQETLERLQTAYRSELYEALKAHLSIEPGTNYIIAPPTTEKVGWVIVHEKAYIPKDSVKPVETIEKKEGILYPVAKKEDKDKVYTYIKTTRIGTNLVYGTGTSKTAYFDYEAQYLTSEMYNSADKTVPNTDALTVNYYLLENFQIVKDINGILNTIDDKIRELKTTLENSIGNVKTTLESSIGSVKTTLESSIGSVKTNLESSIGAVKDSCLHINGDNAMLGDLTLKSVDQNTEIKDTAGNITSFKYDSSLLLIDNLGKVIKSEEKFDELIKRIAKLEKDKTSAIPIGMVAIWGKPAPFPEGWEEYVPLRGKMPVGLFNPTLDEMSDELDGDRGNNVTYYRDSNGMVVFPFDTLGNTGGRVGKNLRINEMPRHTHDYNDIYFSEHWGTVIVPNNVGTGDNDGDNKGYQMLRTSFPTGGTDGGAIGSATPFSLLNPYRVVQFIEYTGRPSDKTAPTAPTLMASNIGTTSVSLNWSGATDEFGVTDYIVYGNGNLLISVGNVFNRTIYGLAPGTEYTFSVKAKDAAGNLSVDSNIVTVTTNTIDLTQPSAPNYINGFLEERNQIYIEWGAALANDNVVSFEVWRRTAGGISSLRYTADVSENYFYDTGAYNTTYYYKVRAKNSIGNYSEFTYEVDVTTGSNGGSCFDVESLVTMVSGQSKKLKNVVVGDQLQGFSFPNEVDESEGDYMSWSGKLSEATKVEVTVVNKITSIQPNYYEIKAADTTTVRATAFHPLLVTEDGENVQWVCVKNITPNMLLIDKTGKIKPIESILFKDEPLEVALLDVESVDSYVISGIVAHNLKPIEEIV